MAKQVRMLDRFAKALANELTVVHGEFDLVLFDKSGEETTEIEITSVEAEGNTITMNAVKDTGKKRRFIATLVVTEWHRAPSTK